MADRNVVLVCGGRDYDNLVHVANVLDGLHRHLPITLVVQGGATGADELARIWANRMGVECMTFAADWKAHGRAAGPIRNQKMLDETSPNYVIAFPGGRGTRDMTIRARANGYRVETHEVTRCDARPTTSR
ncbi:MAG TPA: DUF2493 domain-containing protein [Microbacterium sp.]|nr:DUF2493 domain-containing protein [Microbacterium sp.]